jgi:hypothetical protein
LLISINERLMGKWDTSVSARSGCESIPQGTSMWYATATRNNDHSTKRSHEKMAVWHFKNCWFCRHSTNTAALFCKVLIKDSLTRHPRTLIDKLNIF